MSHTVEVSWHGTRVAQVSFSDPARENQICWAAVDELAESLHTCRRQGARVVVLASNLGGHWLEHAWLQDLSNGLEGESQTGAGTGWFSVLQELSQEPLITIAAISGNSSGGGAEIGWACDLRIAEVQAQFSQPEINLGLTTGIGGCSRLARLAGRGIAAEMVLTGRPMSAQRLYELGAINRVVASGESVGCALALGQELACKSWGALQGLKSILAASDRLPLDKAMENEQEIFQAVAVTDEARSAIKAAQQQYDRGVSQ